MTTVACVLRSGGEYRPIHVRALALGVHHETPDAPIAVLSDVPAAHVDRRPLTHRWPGWWSKMELFRPGLFTGRVLYLDLDTVVTGDLSDLLGYAGGFAMLSDFYRPERPASGVMAWEAGCSEARAIWEAFTGDPAAAMRTTGGDQAFIRSVLGDSVGRLQDLHPGQIVSYKVHCQEGIPAGARLVCAHGRPKPWDAEWRL